MEFRLALKADSTSRWSWIAGAFYSQERQHTEFDSYVNGYSETPSFEYYSEYEANLTGNELPGTDRWFLGVTTPSSTRRPSSASCPST